MDTDSVDFTARDQESEVAVSQRWKFTPEFRAEEVRLVLDTGRPIAQLARDISVVEETLGNCVSSIGPSTSVRNQG